MVSQRTGIDPEKLWSMPRKTVLTSTPPLQVFATQSYTTVLGVPIPKQDLVALATVTSLDIDMANIGRYSVQFNIICPGACAGTITWFSSNDKINFVEITPLTQTIVATDSILFNNINAGFKWLRLEILNQNAIDTFNVEAKSSLKVGI